MKYTKEQILDGIECWMNPDNDIWCESCAFHSENRVDCQTGGCRQAVLEAAKEALREEAER